MESDGIPPCVHLVIGAIAKCVGPVILIPFTAAFLFSQSMPATPAVITSTLIIRYGAAPVGIGPGCHPAFVLLILAGVALGITLFLIDPSDMPGWHSGWVTRFPARSEEKVKQSPLLSRYGMYGLVPCVITRGFCFCLPVPWVFASHRNHAFHLIMGGVIAIPGIVIPAAPGLFSVIFH